MAKKKSVDPEVEAPERGDECQLKFKGCLGSPAMYGRRKQYAKVGPWLDCCENCVKVPYEVPPQFQEGKK
jgi:hypothetical protein